jgi:ferrochelatase
VETYFTDIRGGRPPSPEALEVLKDRYRRLGGKTPLLEITRATAERLEAQLAGSGAASLNRGTSARPEIGATPTSAQAGSWSTQPPASSAAVGGPRSAVPPIPVYFAMRHWHPFIREVVPRMASDGVRSALAIALAPHYSRMSVGSYRQAVEQANAQLAEPIAFSFVERWHDQPAYRALMAARVREALAGFPGEAKGMFVLFTAHSLPERILTWDDPYPRELRESAAAIAALAGVQEWAQAYQSAAMTGEPWLGPDILRELERLAAEGRRQVLVVPFGFVAEHLEVLYDVDVQAQEKAAELGLTLRRTAMLNADPAFVDVLASIAREHAGTGP